MTNVPRAVRARRSWDSERRRQRGLLSADIAVRLGKRGHDVAAVVADSSLVGLADQQILPEAAASGRALVTANIKDFIPLDAQYKTTGRQHAGLVLVSTKTFPQDRRLLSALTDALDVLLTTTGGIGPDRAVFLRR
jgi:hypothetical protein